VRFEDIAFRSGKKEEEEEAIAAQKRKKKKEKKRCQLANNYTVPY